MSQNSSIVKMIHSQFDSIRNCAFVDISIMLFVFGIQRNLIDQFVAQPESKLMKLVAIS